MTDPRLIPDSDRITRRDLAQIALPVVDLCRTPNGSRDRQLLLGAQVTVFEDSRGWCYVQATKDGYCGFVRSMSLGPEHEPTHKITAPASHAYLAPDIKSADRMALSFGSVLNALGIGERFIETSAGFVPTQHVSPMQQMMDDPAAVADLFLGVPYLWGGNSHWGIDCSGLVQAAFEACGIDSPGDSDLQQASLGEPVENGAPYLRNDLLFWKGHVAIVRDRETLIHANAFRMAVAIEPIRDAIQRIADQGDGAVTAHRRIKTVGKRGKAEVST